MKIGQIKVKELKARPVAYISFIGNYMGNVQVFSDLFNKLCEWAGPKKLIGPDTVFSSAYYDDPNITPPDELRLDVCINIPEDASVDGEIQKQVLSGGKYVVMNSELSGPEEYGPAWNAVVEWMQQNSYEIDMTRPSYEIYLNNPEEHPEKHHIIDICMSAKEKKDN